MRTFQNRSYLRDGTRTGNTVVGVIILEFHTVERDVHPGCLVKVKATITHAWLLIFHCHSDKAIALDTYI